LDGEAVQGPLGRDALATAADAYQLHDPEQAALDALPMRESQCLYWLSEGKSAPVIADILCISPHTVQQYVKSCVVRLKAKHRQALLRHATAAGLLVRDGESSKIPSIPQTRGLPRDERSR
jgi:DNA-binding CsgD family transcriptional regulator